jgi:hypothetical protein
MHDDATLGGCAAKKVRKGGQVDMNLTGSLVHIRGFQIGRPSKHLVIKKAAVARFDVEAT